MTSVVRALRRRRRAVTRSQRGFALLLTLGLMAFFSVVVVALLGMTLNSAGISTLQGKAAREQRAAESALDAKINQLRDDPTPRAAGDTGCPSPSPDQITIDAVITTVECVWQDGSGPLVPAVPNRSLKVIGTGLYSGALGGTSLTSDAPNPLLVTGDALVKTHASGPLAVGGAYQQGDCPVDANVTDLDGVTPCGPTDAADALNLGDGDEVANSDRTWTPTVVTNRGQSVGPCAPGDTVTLNEGSYDQDATAALNDWSASCLNATFYFKAGNYWFDVGDDQNNTLTFNRPGSKWTFGGPDATSTFPADCSDLAKVNITLSPRTTMAHGAGQVAICGAVSQTATPSLPWRIVPESVTSEVADNPVGCQGDPADNKFVPNSGALAVDQPSRAQFNFTSGTGCYTDEATLRYALPVTNDPSPVRSLVVHLDASGNYANGAQARTIFTVRHPDASVACTVEFLRINDDDAQLDYDLTNPPPTATGTCRDRFEKRADLDGALIDVTFRVHAFVHDSNTTSPTTLPIPCGSVSGSGAGSVIAQFCVEVRNMFVTSGWSLAPGAAVNAGGPGYANWSPSPLAGGSPALLTVPAGAGFRDFRAEFSGFSFAANDPFVPSDRLSSLAVEVSGSANQGWYVWDPNQQRIALTAGLDGTPDDTALLGGFVSAVLSYDNGTKQCGGLTDGLPLWGEALHVDLWSPQKTVGVTPTCQGENVTPAQLKGAKVIVIIRVRNALDEPQFPFLTGASGTSAVQTISSIRLVATPSENSYTHPVHANTVTFSETNSFNVFGSWSTPRNDFGVAWNGDPPNPNRPVVDGEMVVNGVASTQQLGATVGVICCSEGQRAERVVDLTASVGTRPVASTTTRIVDFNGVAVERGFKVFVDRWTVCRTRPADCPP